MLVNGKWQDQSKSRADIFFTFQLDRTAHFLYQSVNDRHTESGPFVNRPGTGIFLCKRFKNMLLKFRTDTDTGIRNYKFVNNILMYLPDDLCVYRDRTTGLIVFNCIA